MNTNGIKQAFENFMSNEQEVHKAIDSSTSAGLSGSGYSIELFDDGHYRILWDNHIGNLYKSPGMILSIPEISSDDWDDDPVVRYYENAIEILRQNFEYMIDEE